METFPMSGNYILQSIFVQHPYEIFKSAENIKLHKNIKITTMAVKHIAKQNSYMLNFGLQINQNV